MIAVTEPARLRLHRLLAEFRADEMDTGTFSNEFERTYNLELDKGTLSPSEAQAFGKLFERVIWYSPFPEERAKIPNYLGEEEIRSAADEAARRIVDFPAKARHAQETIREILLREWDPIGIAELSEAQDEYDAYVVEVYWLLSQHAKQSEVFRHLWSLETEHMGLCGDRQRTEKVAERLAGLANKGIIP
jgi:hypothetical protein